MSRTDLLINIFLFDIIYINEMKQKSAFRQFHTSEQRNLIKKSSVDNYFKVA